MADSTYNGWKNYATWRVNLEMVDADYLQEGYAEKPEANELADHIEEDCKDYITENGSDNKLAVDYALAFLDDVDWREIADHILADWPED
jgi:hypothetical protein